MRLGAIITAVDPARADPVENVTRRGGRPSREQAAQLGENILDAATDLFLAEGYGATSIEAVAQRAGISKRTFYARYPDKAALFGAVVHRIIQGLRPPAGVPYYEGTTPEEILRSLARLILRAALAPMAISLNRLMMAEAPRFAELTTIVAGEGSRGEAVGLIAALLRREAEAGNLAIDNPDFAAEQFLHILLAVPQRRAMGFGTPMTNAERDAWTVNCVNLFLNGCRFWKPGAGV